MRKNQGIEYITISVLRRLSKILDRETPDYVVVQGDTTTAMAASMAAFYRSIKVAHVEAGLRTWDKLRPYPEEVNRRIIDSVSDLFFVHSREAKDNLLCEGVDRSRIKITGNTVIDALLQVAGRDFQVKGSLLEGIPFSSRRVILVTAHRRESFGKPLMNICQALKHIAARYARDVFIVYPVHLNPNVQKTAHAMLGGLKNILLITPLDYFTFVHLMKRSYLILTDSGGLQEEAPSLHKPVLVLREKTERPEVVATGAVRIAGIETQGIIKKTRELLDDKGAYARMARAVNPYGDGKASQRIVEHFLKEANSHA
jgi:UDP-N-acetylglucosamine 2-epimerase